MTMTDNLKFICACVVMTDNLKYNTNNVCRISEILMMHNLCNLSYVLSPPSVVSNIICIDCVA